MQSEGGEGKRRRRRRRRSFVRERASDSMRERNASSDVQKDFFHSDSRVSKRPARKRGKEEEKEQRDARLTQRWRKGHLSSSHDTCC